MNTNLIEITTQRQLKNGTRMFKCTRTGAYYGSYASGYVRRKVNANSQFYQLNKTFKPFPDVSNIIGRERLTTEESRLKLINQRSLKFRTNTEQTNTGKEEVMLNASIETNVRPTVITKSRSFTGARKNLKWPSYIFQVVHSSMMLNETPDMIADRVDQMLTDIPDHRFNFNTRQEKIEAISNVMQHLQSRARQSVDRMIDLVDNFDRTRG
jgi:hypothetical protein